MNVVTVAVDRLVSLVAPPAMPVDADGDWRSIENVLGRALPSDFKVLLGRYGVGTFDDIRLLTPFDTHPQRVFDRPIASRPERVRILRDHLAPTADRGSSEDLLWGRHDRFKAIERDWLLTYHKIRDHPDGIIIAFPPEDDDQARDVIFTAVHAMDSRVLGARGHPEPVWGDDATS